MGSMEYNNRTNDKTLPNWYLQFEVELKEMFNLVSNIYPNVILTGSGSIAYLLANLKMYEELENFKPNDLDFLYKARIGEPNRKTIGDYEIIQDMEQETSVTFILGKNSLKYIKSFDITKTFPKTKSFELNGIEIINLNTLKSDYKPDFGTPQERIEKDKYKIELIERIIQKIKIEGKTNHFGLDNNIQTNFNILEFSPMKKNKLF